MARLHALGVAERLARVWIGEHGAAAVETRLALVEECEGVRAPAAYLSAAIAGGWEEAPEPLSPPPPSPEALARLEAARRAEAAVVEAGAARAAEARRAAVLAAAAARSPVQRDADRRLFEGRLEDEFDRASFARYGWACKLNAAAICAFWEELRPGIFEAAEAPDRAPG